MNLLRALLASFPVADYGANRLYRDAPPLPGKARPNRGRVTRLLWDSYHRGTYRRAVHGPLGEEADAHRVVLGGRRPRSSK